MNQRQLVEQDNAIQASYFYEDEVYQPQPIAIPQTSQSDAPQAMPSVHDVFESVGRDEAVTITQEIRVVRQSTAHQEQKPVDPVDPVDDKDVYVAPTFSEGEKMIYGLALFIFLATLAFKLAEVIAENALELSLAGVVVAGSLYAVKTLRDDRLRRGRS